MITTKIRCTRESRAITIGPCAAMNRTPSRARKVHRHSRFTFTGPRASTLLRSVPHAFTSRHQQATPWYADTKGVLRRLAETAPTMFARPAAGANGEFTETAAASAGKELMYNVLQRSPHARVTIIFLALMPAYGALAVRQYSNSRHFQTRLTAIDAMTPHQSRARPAVR